ncbi:hypothetical protein [Streptomyces sp. NRRL S-87]|uniref:hypothetical protein n=1 Tax=Streptomyces sp. NRRL S-87 TaxID=1463920 RepID=UPI00131E359E|nr:hypothetical protein [Streptomyces sp. NRRL S-87]
MTALLWIGIVAAAWCLLSLLVAGGYAYGRTRHKRTRIGPRTGTRTRTRIRH